MAAAEARATWQRVANRCYVQEDAKRAPKLACRTSSSAKPPYDENGGDTFKEIDPPNLNFMSLNRNLLDSNVSSETKWWLQFQPNHGYQNDFKYGKSNVPEEMEIKKIEHIVPDSKFSHDSIRGTKVYDDIPSLDKNNMLNSDPPQVIPVNSRSSNSVPKVEELKANSYLQSPFEHKMDGSKGDGLFDWETIDTLTSKKSEDDYFIVNTQSTEKKKSEPWWIADKEDLAMFVAQRSMEQIDNCDLPPPHRVHTTLEPSDFLESSNEAGLISASSQDSHVDHTRQRQASYFDSTYGQKTPTDTAANSSVESEHVFSGDETYNAAAGDPQKKTQASDVDASKTQLLEALCHSQTRARKAEIAAQKAHDEKEHVVTLLFRQASHLFAYRQWLRLLQLESLCLQLKIREHHISSLLPDNLWVTSAPNNDRPRKAVRRRKKQNCGFCRNLFAFVIGFSLASAGLLLGWTAGCLLTFM